MGPTGGRLAWADSDWVRWWVEGVTAKEARGGHSLGAEERDPSTDASPQVKGTLKEEPSDRGIF